MADNLIRDLNDWKKTCTFKSADQAFDLHFLVWRLLEASGRADADAMAKAVLEIQPSEPTRKRAHEALAALMSGEQGSGSGFVVAEGGYILTNNHVVEDAGGLEIEVDGRRIAARLIAQDEKRDMALIRADEAASSLKPLPITGGKTRPGDAVIAVGFPLGKFRQQDGSVTGELDGSRIGIAEAHMLSLSCPINPGNSGGPICNIQGEVVGMVTVKTAAGQFITSEGGALPPATLRDFLSDCQAKDPELKLPVAKQADGAAREPNNWADVGELVRPAVVKVFRLKPKAAATSKLAD